MKLRSLVIVAATLLVSVTSLTAQQRNGEKMNCEEMAKHRTEMLKKEAKLDDAQAKSALEIYTKACKEAKEAQKNNDKESALKIRKESTEAIKALLTPEQAKLWSDYQEKMKNERKNKSN